MSLHKDKFEYMCHRSNRQHNTLAELPFWPENFTYTVSETITLYPVHQLRDLGVIISSDASWTPHIQTIVNKARQKASWVLSVFRTRSPAVMLTLYKSMVRSLLEYCSPLWNPIKIGDIQDLESVQHNFISRIAGTKENELLGAPTAPVSYVSTTTKRAIYHSSHVEDRQWSNHQ